MPLCAAQLSKLTVPAPFQNKNSQEATAGTGNRTPAGAHQSLHRPILKSKRIDRPLPIHVLCNIAGHSLFCGCACRRRWRGEWLGADYVHEAIGIVALQLVDGRLRQQLFELADRALQALILLTVAGSRRPRPGQTGSQVRDKTGHARLFC